MTAEKLLSEENVNTKRQVEFDYLKFFSIFFMIIIHVFEEISIYATGAECGVFGNIISYFAGPLAAPLFMFSMGVGMIYTRHDSPKEFFIRGLKLFIFAYLLNFVRDGLRDIIIGVATNDFCIEDVIYSCFNIDILHFAGLAFMAIALLKKLKVSVPLMFVIAASLQIFGYCLINFVPFESDFLNYFLGLFIYTCEASCFPFTLWFIYPVSGMLTAGFLRRVNNVDKWYKGAMIISLLILLGYWSFYITNYGFGSLTIFYSLENDEHYKQSFLSFLLDTSLISFYAAVFYFFSKTKLSKKLESKVIFVGSHLNEIYINQWLLIGFFNTLFILEIAPYLNYYLVIPVAFVIWVAAILFAKLTRKFTAKFL